MFEKSLFDLIKGLRNHKGNEKEFILHSLRECRVEIRGSDMDLKTTALLKIIYLEMFGHDMSWASFNVLEAMSSAKYFQKRIGYLGAVQSFRPDTEVLMLATNLLKKDITSSSLAVISLPILTLPHVVTPSLAMSLLPDIMPRLSHSNASIRKKTVVTVYRLALTYPETLRTAWPKLKDMLMNTNEDPSVTAAIINVVCELGWRRPRDFLPLAPRLFDLLIDGGNNWMAIKIIKLFATLTPLEPRLTRKLLPPLTKLIRTTPAMSLLYECINGVVQGGILQDTDGVREGEEVASLCVGKLRGMIASDGDPNLKYVALLAYNKIVTSYPQIVAAQEHTILACIDDPDFSIRLEALKLLSGLIDTRNIVGVVDHLMGQLGSRISAARLASFSQIIPQGTQDKINETRETSPTEVDPAHNAATHMPDDYRMTVIRSILKMCSQDSYTNVSDFQWYLKVLVELCEEVSLDESALSSHDTTMLTQSYETIAALVGSEFRNLAVRVGDMRSYVVSASSSILTAESRQPPMSQAGSQEVLHYAAWVVGEYAEFLSSVPDTLDALLLLCKSRFDESLTCVTLQSIPKLIIAYVNSVARVWNGGHKSGMTLLLAKVVRFYEQYIWSPNFEVQERAVELFEVFRLAEEAVKSHLLEQESPPLLLAQALPSLFDGPSLNAVAPSAQKKVPYPESLDLSAPINYGLSRTITRAEQEPSSADDAMGFRKYYQETSRTETMTEAALDRLDDTSKSDSHPSKRALNSVTDALFNGREERLEDYKDDPYYIRDVPDSGTSAPAIFHNMLIRDRGQEIDIDAIPIIDLHVGPPPTTYGERNSTRQKQRQAVHISADEGIESDDDVPVGQNTVEAPGMRPSRMATKSKVKRSLLEVDSSGIGRFGSESDIATPGTASTSYDYEVENEAMMKALAEVEQARLEMQRAAERVKSTDDIPDDGMLVKKRSRKKAPKTYGNETISQQLQVSHEYDARNPAIKKKGKKISEPDQKTESTSKP